MKPHHKGRHFIGASDGERKAFRASVAVVVIVFALVIAIGVLLPGCAPANDPPPVKLAQPDARLMAEPKPLADLPPEAKGNAPMVSNYAQCRLAHADEADLRIGLIGYVRASRGKP